MKWKDCKKDPPPMQGEWSEKDYLVCCLYKYTIGRVRQGDWVDMKNNDIDAILWCEIPLIDDKFHILFDDLHQEQQQTKG